jgi:hypothetical protein
MPFYYYPFGRLVDSQLPRWYRRCRVQVFGAYSLDLLGRWRVLGRDELDKYIFKL